MGGRWWEQMDWGGELGRSGSGGRDLVMVDGLGSLVRVHNFLHSLTERSPERAKQQVKHPDFLRFLNRIRLPFLGISVTRGGDETFVKSLNTKEEVRSGGLLLHEAAAAAAGPHPKSIEGERVEAEAAARTTTTALNTDLLFQLPTQINSGGAVTKEELGRATWTFLHTLAAQYPEKPTKQQQRDVKELMSIFSRLYPCKQCADHFVDVLKSHPVKASSGYELAQWMCKVHNVVNRSLGKPQFPCQRVAARWGQLDCEEGACDLEGHPFSK
ncbi:hypothetical protein CY35_18G024800 [Sphagnum magellanicum]|nr:hypothetical protein CY35_18G024800 [Sphagnum magellanicum]KAH9532921.1 hypothetical protein CY35_18G024800 [Sphagnum magellanicum]